MRKLTTYLILSSFSFITLGNEIVSESAREAQLKEHVQDWDVRNTLTHMNNHINNNLRLFDVLMGYAQNGIPATVDDAGEAIPAVSASDVRKSFKIPEEFWADPAKRKELKSFIGGFLTIHDAAKVDTSSDYLKEQDKKLPKEKKFLDKKGHLKNIYIIQGLDRAFGTNPFKLEGLSEKDKKKMIEAQKVIKMLNQVDENTGDNLLNKRALVSKNLAPHWVIEAAEIFEKTVDGVERSENPVSRHEFGRPMIKGSKEQPLGYGKFRKKTEAEYKSPKNVVLINLEKDYAKSTEHYLDYDKRVKGFFKTLKQVGLDVDQLDPIRRYELIPLLMDNNRKLEGYDRQSLRRKIFFQHKSKIAGLFNTKIAGQADFRQKFLDEAKAHKIPSNLVLTPRVVAAYGFNLTKKQFKDYSKNFSAISLASEAKKHGKEAQEALKTSINNNGSNTQKKRFLMQSIRDALLANPDAALCD